MGWKDAMPWVLKRFWRDKVNISMSSTLFCKLSQTEGLEAYFNAEEIEGAKKYLEIFHGRFLINDELSRGDAVLIGVYMLCNNRKLSEVTRDDARSFVLGKLGVNPDDFTKGVYDLKARNLLAERDDKLSLAFKGLKKVRHMFSAAAAGTKTPEHVATMPSPEGVPSIGTPASVREAIYALLRTDWGKKPRTLKEIVEAFETNALYYPKTRIAAALTEMTRYGLLRGLKSGGAYAYVLAKKA